MQSSFHFPSVYLLNLSVQDLAWDTAFKACLRLCMLESFQEGYSVRDLFEFFSFMVRLQMFAYSKLQKKLCHTLSRSHMNKMTSWMVTLNFAGWNSIFFPGPFLPNFTSRKKSLHRSTKDGNYKRRLYGCVLYRHFFLISWFVRYMLFSHYFRNGAISYRDYLLSMIINAFPVIVKDTWLGILDRFSPPCQLVVGMNLPSSYQFLAFRCSLDALFLLPSKASSGVTFLIGKTAKNLLELFYVAHSLSCFDMFHVIGIWKRSSWPLISTPAGLAHCSISCESSDFTAGFSRTITLKLVGYVNPTQEE